MYGGMMKNRKVMVIDDDRESLEELKEMLELSGYELIAVSDTSKALDIAGETKPAVVLFDLKIPDKSGFQIADELKHFSELLRIPIIAMTGSYKNEDDFLMHACGIKKCLKKPFQPLDVIAEIEEVLRKNREHQGSE
jgi:DNA-binding response OmpR family regulator